MEKYLFNNATYIRLPLKPFSLAGHTRITLLHVMITRALMKQSDFLLETSMFTSSYQTQAS